MSEGVDIPLWGNNSVTSFPAGPFERGHVFENNLKSQKMISMLCLSRMIIEWIGGGKENIILFLSGVFLVATTSIVLISSLFL